MLDLPDSLLVSSFLFHFMLSIALCQGCIPVRGCIWVEYPDINEGFFISPAPKPVSSDIQSCSLSGDGRAHHHSFACYFLQSRLHSDFVTYLCQQCGSEVSFSLWRIDGNPPRGQERTCSTVKLEPHTQVMGVRVGGQPQRRASASTKAPLCKQNPCSAIYICYICILQYYIHLQTLISFR